jgi:hypothetical protein
LIAIAILRLVLASIKKNDPRRILSSQRFQHSTYVEGFRQLTS